MKKAFVVNYVISLDREYNLRNYLKNKHLPYLTRTEVTESD